MHFFWTTGFFSPVYYVLCFIILSDAYVCPVCGAQISCLENVYIKRLFIYSHFLPLQKNGKNLPLSLSTYIPTYLLLAYIKSHLPVKIVLREFSACWGVSSCVCHSTALIRSPNNSMNIWSILGLPGVRKTSFFFFPQTISQFLLTLNISDNIS